MGTSHPKEELAEIDEGKEDIVANKKDFFHVPWDKHESSGCCFSKTLVESHLFSSFFVQER